MTKQERIKLSEKCGYTNDLYHDKVKKRVGKKYKHPVEEIAILRKAVAYLFELIGELHSGEINNTEFAEYNAIVEQIKAEVKSELS